MKKREKEKKEKECIAEGGWEERGSKQIKSLFVIKNKEG